MKKQKKYRGNISVLLWIVALLVIMIITTEGIGFIPKSGGNSFTLTEMRNRINDSSYDYSGPELILLKNSYGLMVSGIIFTSLAILPASWEILFKLPNMQKKSKLMTITMFLLFLGFILLIAGEGLFYSNFTNTFSGGNQLLSKGAMAWMIILLLILWIPTFFWTWVQWLRVSDKEKKLMNRPRKEFIRA